MQLAASKSSAGLMVPPLLEYRLAIPLFLKRDLLSAAQFAALGLHEWPSLVRLRLADGGDSLALGIVQIE